MHPPQPAPYLSLILCTVFNLHSTSSASPCTLCDPCCPPHILPCTLLDPPHASHALFQPDTCFTACISFCTLMHLSWPVPQLSLPLSIPLCCVPNLHATSRTFLSPSLIHSCTHVLPSWPVWCFSCFFPELCNGCCATLYTTQVTTLRDAIVLYDLISWPWKVKSQLPLYVVWLGDWGDNVANLFQARARSGLACYAFIQDLFHFLLMLQFLWTTSLGS